MKTQAFPTMITPFDKDGAPDVGAMRAMMDWYAENGCGGVFAACQSSEIFFLTEKERVLLTKTAVRRAEELAALHPDRPRMTVVASGHISDRFEDQVRELKAVADAGPDTVILISNRMDIENTGEDAWIRETERLMEALPDVPLGIYECPHPYTRLMSDRMLAFCAESGRFLYMKDTCCDAALMAHRAQILRGTPMKLYNANGQTLLESLRGGAAGYCGVMCNFHPDIYAWLCAHWESDPEEAENVQAFLGTAAFTEALAYPVTAKYHLKELIGLPLETIDARTRPASDLTDYHKSSVRQMEKLAAAIRTRLAERGKEASR